MDPRLIKPRKNNPQKNSSRQEANKVVEPARAPAPVSSGASGTASRAPVAPGVSASSPESTRASAPIAPAPIVPGVSASSPESAKAPAPIAPGASASSEPARGAETARTSAPARGAETARTSAPARAEQEFNYNQFKIWANTKNQKLTAQQLFEEYRSINPKIKYANARKYITNKKTGTIQTTNTRAAEAARARETERAAKEREEAEAAKAREAEAAKAREAEAAKAREAEAARVAREREEANRVAEAARVAREREEAEAAKAREAEAARVAREREAANRLAAETAKAAVEASRLAAEAARIAEANKSRTTAPSQSSNASENNQYRHFKNWYRSLGNRVLEKNKKNATKILTKYRSEADGNPVPKYSNVVSFIKSLSSAAPRPASQPVPQPAPSRNNRAAKAKEAAEAERAAEAAEAERAAKAERAAEAARARETERAAKEREEAEAAKAREAEAAKAREAEAARVAREREEAEAARVAKEREVPSSPERTSLREKCERRKRINEERAAQASRTEGSGAGAGSARRPPNESPSRNKKGTGAGAGSAGAANEGRTRGAANESSRRSGSTGSAGSAGEVENFERNLMRIKNITNMKDIRTFDDLTLWIFIQPENYFDEYNSVNFHQLLESTSLDPEQLIEIKNVLPKECVSEFGDLPNHINYLEAVLRVVNKVLPNKAKYFPEISNYFEKVRTNPELRIQKEKREKIHNILKGIEENTKPILFELYQNLVILILDRRNRRINNSENRYLSSLNSSADYRDLIVNVCIAKSCNRRNIKIFGSYNIEDGIAHDYYKQSLELDGRGNLMEETILKKPSELLTSIQENNFYDTNVRGDGFCSIWAFIFGYLLNNPSEIPFEGTKIQPFLMGVLNNDNIIGNINTYLNSRKIIKGKEMKYVEDVLKKNLFKINGNKILKLHPIYILIAIHLYCIALSTLSEQIDFDEYTPYSPESIRLINHLCTTYNFDRMDEENYIKGYNCLKNRMKFPKLKITINGEPTTPNGTQFDAANWDDEEMINRLSDIKYMFRGVVQPENMENLEKDYYSTDIFYYLSYFLDSPFCVFERYRKNDKAIKNDLLIRQSLLAKLRNRPNVRNLPPISKIFFNMMYAFTGNPEIRPRKNLLHIFNRSDHFQSLNPSDFYDYNNENKTFRNNPILTIWWKNNWIDSDHNNSFINNSINCFATEIQRLVSQESS